jgi:hypothetical protein
MAPFRANGKTLAKMMTDDQKYDAILRYFASENTTFWAKNQAFLFGSAALAGLALNEISGLRVSDSWTSLCFGVVATAAGIVLACFWHKSITSSSNWRNHLRAVLEKLEPNALGDVSVIRGRPANTTTVYISAKSTAWLFTVLWTLMMGFVVVLCVVKGMR